VVSFLAMSHTAQELLPTANDQMLFQPLISTPLCHINAFSHHMFMLSMALEEEISKLTFVKGTVGYNFISAVLYHVFIH
jgi:hypothetical protein